MTNPDQDPVTHAQQLEDIVDELGEKVANEREAEGVPGKPSEREQAATGGTKEEPPD